MLTEMRIKWSWITSTVHLWGGRYGLPQTGLLTQTSIMAGGAHSFIHIWLTLQLSISCEIVLLMVSTSSISAWFWGSNTAKISPTVVSTLWLCSSIANQFLPQGIQHVFLPDLVQDRESLGVPDGAVQGDLKPHGCQRGELVTPTDSDRGVTQWMEPEILHHFGHDRQHHLLG